MESLPSSLTAPTSALVGFLGLNSPKHSVIWDAFRKSKGPLRFVNVENLEFPPLKPKRTSYEWYFPKGILKRNWMEKHLYKIPAVVVVFVELDWNHPNWVEKTVEVASKVKSIRTTLSGRGTKLAVVLIQKEASLPSAAVEEDSERASSLCSACDLSPRSLFVLPVSSESVAGYALKLEKAFHELSQNYYHLEIRNIKSHRDCLNKTTHLYLFVRHQFKIGFLNELKQDQLVALKHYNQAYAFLMEVRATDTNIMEVKTVAGFINYKICRLAFALDSNREAISQLRKHADVFRHKVGSDRLIFEHSAWQSQQCSVFAELFKNAIPGEGSAVAVQTQHPGIYYQQAATFAISRRQQAEEAIKEESNNFEDVDLRLLEDADNLEFYGQRTWRPGKAILEPPDMERENAGIKALIYYEKNNVNYSEIIINLLKNAISQFETFKSPRMTAHLTVQVAEELRTDRKYGESLNLLKPVIKAYRKEKWSFLLNSVLSLSLKCSFLIASVAEYASLCFELGSLEIQHVSVEEKKRVTSNLIKLMDGQCPSAEPGLTSKSERAAVSDAFQLWAEKLTSPKDEIPTIDVRSLSSCSLDFKIKFLNEGSVSADSPVVLQCRLVNNGNEYPFLVRSISVVVNGEELCREFQEPLVIAQSCYIEEKFEKMPSKLDVNSKTMSVSGVSAILGNQFRIRLEKTFDKRNISELFTYPRLRCKTEDVSNILNQPDITSIAVKERKSLLQMKILEKSPVLVGEWFKIKIDFFNEELTRIDDFECKTTLVDSQDPIIGDTTSISYNPFAVTDVKSPSDENVDAYTISKYVGNMEPSTSQSLLVYMKASTTGVRNVRIQVSYQIGDQFQCSLMRDLSLETIEPFVISTEFLSIRQRNISRIYTDEPFLCAPEVKSLCPGSIKVINSKIEPRYPIEKYSSDSGDNDEDESSLKNLTLFQNGLARDCFCLLVKRTNLTNHLDVQDISIGKYVMEWRRDEDNDASAHVTSVFELSLAKLSLGSLFAQALLPPYGVVHTPLNLIYRLTNLTDKVQEYSLSIEPSESFMIAGNRQVHFKIIPYKSQTVNYVLYPILAGTKVTLPKLNLKSIRLAQGHDVNETLERLLPEYLTVIPKKSSEADSGGTFEDNFKSSPSVFIESQISQKAVKIKPVKG